MVALVYAIIAGQTSKPVENITDEEYRACYDEAYRLWISGTHYAARTNEGFELVKRTRVEWKRRVR